MPASYVNFYIGQRVVLMPSFGAAADAPARAAIQALFPDRQVIAVPSREILLGGGGIHCITLQEPLGRRAPLGRDSVG
jgi:agmatine deiminase